MTRLPQRIRSAGTLPSLVLGSLLALAAGGCSGEPAGGGGRRTDGDGAPWGQPSAAAAVPVEAAPVTRREISSFIETNGTLEAENEVDVVARVAGRIVELGVEEGLAVRKGQVMARIEDEEIRSQLEIARVALKEAELNYERAKSLQRERLLSAETFEQAETRFETARAQLEGNQILLSYTVIRAPFDGLVVARYVDFAEQVANGTRLFRVSDFTPLLCPIQVPERELRRLGVGQSAYLTVEGWPDERFDARVLRLSPVIDAASGTVKVTLEVDARGKLRPGMFARVFVRVDTRSAALVIPKAALSLESIGDTVYVAKDGVAERREVELGFKEGDFVEVTSGLAEGESVVVVGQDGLSDGTPIQLFGDEREGGLASAAPAAGGGPGGGPQGAGPPDPSSMSPADLERVKERMRARGMSEKEIEERLQQIREGGGPRPQ